MDTIRPPQPLFYFPYMKITPSAKQRTIETTVPELDSRTIAQLSCGLIEDLLIRPLQRTGRLSPDDLSTIQQVQGVISMLGEKAGTLEDLLEGQPHQDSAN
jgi:hypothetical protein